MGQLEKYGLYVLCLVIFLILGVTIWGGGETSRTPVAPMRAPVESAVPPGGGGAKPNQTNQTNQADQAIANGAVDSPLDLDSLLAPEVRSHEPKKGGEKPVDAGDKARSAGATDAVVGGTGGGAAPVAKPEGKPEAVGETKRPTYKIQAGDNLESIARTKLGDAKLYPEIARLNPTVKANKMRVGLEIVLPSAADIARIGAARKPAEPVVDAKATAAKDASKDKGTATAVITSAGERSYVVGKGDSFSRIAQVQLGSAKRVDELREMNPGVDPTRLRVGQRIQLPKK